VRPSNAVARILTITDTADYLIDDHVTTPDRNKGARLAATKPTEAEVTHQQLVRPLIDIGRRADKGEVLTSDQADEIIDAINRWGLLRDIQTELLPG
jgi:hypothetical protein